MWMGVGSSPSQTADAGQDPIGARAQRLVIEHTLQHAMGQLCNVIEDLQLSDTSPGKLSGVAYKMSTKLSRNAKQRMQKGVSEVQSVWPLEAHQAHAGLLHLWLEYYTWLQAVDGHADACHCGCGQKYVLSEMDKHVEALRGSSDRHSTPQNRRLSYDTDDSERSPPPPATPIAVTCRCRGLFGSANCPHAH